MNHELQGRFLEGIIHATQGELLVPCLGQFQAGKETCILHAGETVGCLDQWIGLRENLQKTMIFYDQR